MRGGCWRGRCGGGWWCGLADQAVVLGVGADPDPDDLLSCSDSERALMFANANGHAIFIAL